MADQTAAGGLPSTNRGVSETERIGVTIDWLAASVDLLSVLTARNAVEDRYELVQDLNGSLGLCVMEVVGHIAEHFFGDMLAARVIVLGERKTGTFYAWRVNLNDATGEKIGQIEVGGRPCILDGKPAISTDRKDGTPTARIELTGTGCRLYETSSGCDHAQRWSLLASLLGLCDARITRIDIAADDFQGQYPITWAMERYEAGEFDRRGQRPNARFIDDMGSKKGKTLYIGSRQSENQLRAYEKGREKGDPDSEWMRYEGEFHASHRRDLPLDMLTDPAPYLIGAYPVLHFIEGIGERLRIATEEVLASCKRAVMHFRHQYGPMLNAMLHAAGGDEATLARLVIGTARSKFPEWCGNAANASQLLTTILFAPMGQQPAETA